MIDLIGIKGLALGGMVAAVVGAWSHVKGWLAQISSLVVIQAQMDYQIERRISLHLRRKWKLLPSGISIFTGVWLTHRSKGSVVVPFKIPPVSSIWYRGFSFVIYKRSSGGGGTLYSIRGLIDFQSLIKISIIEQDEVCAALTEDTSRYMVNEVYGTAGERMFGLNRQNTADTVAPANLASSDSYNSIELDTTIDKSFMYASEEFNHSHKIDPFEHMFYSDEQMEYVNEAKLWLQLKDWYQERSIPWRRGWILHGPGGTGKTDFAKTNAKVLKIPLINMVLSSMTDKEFIEHWRSLPTPCVVLFDDFDTVFHKRENVTPHKALSFETILGQLSGVNSFNGIFLMITTNHLEQIDEALGISINEKGLSTRPGRIDRVIHMGAACLEVREKIVKQILRDWDKLWDTTIQETDNLTVAQTQELCRQRAFEEMERQAAQASLEFSKKVVSLTSRQNGKVHPQRPSGTGITLQ